MNLKKGAILFLALISAGGNCLIARDLSLRETDAPVSRAVAQIKEQTNSDNDVERTVSGRILDENNAGVAGTAVVVKGGTRGVMADVDGRFSITVKNSDVLVISFLGYEDKEVTVGTQSVINVTLEPQKNKLDEVTVVAYGTQRKSSVIGSISTISTDQLATPVGQLSSGLAGKLAGIVVMQRTGEPGAGADFWIRGVNTFSQQQTFGPCGRSRAQYGPCGCG